MNLWEAAIFLKRIASNWECDWLDFRIPVHLLAYALSVLFSVSCSFREEGNMQISEGVF